MYSVVGAASYAFVASRAQSRVLQDHTLRDSGVYGMDSNFNRALDGLKDVILDFDIRGFATNDIVPHKAKQVLASALSSKFVNDMDVKFDMTTRHKAFLLLFVSHTYSRLSPCYSY